MKQQERKVLKFGKRLALDNLELADLPKMDDRWVWREKVKVVAAVNQGLLSLEDACERYAMSLQEFTDWQKTYYGSRQRFRGRRRTENSRVQR